VKARCAAPDLEDGGEESFTDPSGTSSDSKDGSSSAEEFEAAIDEVCD
jgi:hypothetical protein